MPASGSDGLSCDVLVVGGGINGCGIARDLAGRGLSVVLCEQDDLARHTSSASSKLIHGGLRYLEHGELGLVRKALAEREVLLRSAPHLMRPLRFVMPHEPAMRPAWMIRAGLFLYDHLARRELLPASEGIDLRRHPAGAPLQRRFERGFAYSDVWTDDARLVVLNAVDAAARGARVLNYCRCERVACVGGAWQARLRHADGRTVSLAARALVNAAGPWARQFLAEQASLPPARGLRLVRGSHIVVPRLFDHGHAYLFQNPDRRVLFALPYEQAWTLIGTTDVEHQGGPGEAVRLDAGELDYLCHHASRCFARPVRPADVAWSFSGVRPLLDEPGAPAQAVSRDYLLEMEVHAGAPLLNVWGGKLTTYRRLAEDAAGRLCAALGVRRPAWTRDALLPGGDFRAWIGEPQRPDADLARFAAALLQAHPELPAPLLQGWAQRYGSRVALLLQEVGLGREVAPGVREAELRYLRRHEFARRAEDVLWRRTKLGLRLDAAARAAVERWWCEHEAQDAGPAAPRRVPETTVS
nr:glycerol-3-phosphate dehydrogenase [Caldimonas tepidiphila]